MENLKINRIKAVLADKGVSNDALAEKTGKTKTAVSRWCNNRAQPSLKMLYEIAEILEVEARELIVPMEDHK